MKSLLIIGLLTLMVSSTGCSKGTSNSGADAR